MNRRSTLAKIHYTLAAEQYLHELTEILFYNNYFGFRSSAKQYVDSLTEEMEATIHLKMKRKASPYFSRYGKDLWYVSYPKRKQTTWYFFFTCYANDVYLIKYITNNHVAGHFLDD
ncbi:MAG: hypothetical protein LIP05_10980 [Tannerellaceae bacterium]|nr:hypothetical protein [Tannerellaceae bacterium]